MEKEHNHYIGEVVNGLAKEAAYWRSRFEGVQAENERLKVALQQKSGEPDHYINKEPNEPQRQQP